MFMFLMCNNSSVAAILVIYIYIVNSHEWPEKFMKKIKKFYNYIICR